MSLRDEVLGMGVVTVERIEIPEWPGEWWVRVMSGAQRNAWQARMLEGDTSTRMRNVFAELAVRTLCDAEGNLVFEEGDAAKLGEQSGLVLDRIWDVASRLNGLTKEEVEELQKN